MLNLKQDILIGEFPRVAKSRETEDVVQVRFIETKDCEKYIDIRYWKRRSGMCAVPTVNGLSVQWASFPGLMRLLGKIKGEE